MLQNVTFQALNIVAIENNFVSIIVKTASKNSTVLDGTNIGNSFTAVPSNPEYSYAVISILGGSHTLSNLEGFISSRSGGQYANSDHPLSEYGGGKAGQ
jgi:hypothetical protein